MSFSMILAPWSIRKRLLLLLLLIFLPAFGIIAASGLTQRGTEIAKAEKSALLLVQSLAAQQEQIAIGTKQMLSTLAQLPQVQRLDAQACDELFSELNKRFPFYSTIAAATPDGDLFAASSPFKPGSVQLGDRKHIQDAIRTLDFSAGEYIIGRLSKVQSINYTYPVLDGNKNLVAIVIAGFKLNEYAGFIANAHLPEGYAVGIADYKGVRLYRLPENDETPPGKPIPRTSFEQASGGLTMGAFRRIGEDGIARIYAFKQLRLTENLPPYLYMFVGMPEAAIIRKANMEMARNLSILGVAVLFAMCLAWIFVNSTVIRPINQLVRVTQRFGRGAMGTRTNLPHTPHELGHLAKAFDDMASLIETRSVERDQAEDALRKACDESEIRVARRTTELATANEALRMEISERKIIEHSLRASEERFRLLVENAPDAIFVQRQGLFAYMNPAALRLFGATSHDELIGSSIIARVHPSYRQLVKERIDLVNNKKKRAPISEQEFIRLDGTIIDVEISAVPVTYEDQDGALVFVRDITERKRLEEEKNRVEARLGQAQKLEALGTLAGGIAHDFNNILGIMVGYAEMARWDAVEGSGVATHIEGVLKATSRAKDLVRQILAFSRGSGPEKKPVQVGLIVKEAIKMLRASLPATIDIKTAVGSKSLVMADPTQIHQVLMNLCTNAAHAMSAGSGILDVALTDVCLVPESITPHSGLLPGPYVVLTVKDTGLGIAPAVMHRIFDPFFTTKEPGVGTGLGLSVVHGIVQNHGGAVEVESVPGNGATFHVYLPAMEDGASGLETVEDALLPRGRERILIVDDEPALASVTKQVLERLGYEVEYQTNGMEALQAFRNQSTNKPFDLVITDMTMPHITGADLAGELLMLHPGLPIILSTGFSEKVDEEKTKSLGIRGFLMKPVVMRELAEMVRKVLDNDMIC